MKKIVALLFLLTTVWIQQVSSQTQQFDTVKYPAGYRSQIDLVYTKVKDWNGRMDVYFSPNAQKPLPLVLNIHGGGWNHGEKESQTGFGSFFKNGYAVANVEYRLVDKAPAPAAIEDVRCALIYLINNAKIFNIDVDKIVLMGGSAGAHLALMAGLLGNNPIFDSNCKQSTTIKVAAIINKYGVTDLEPLSAWKSAKNWLGNKANNPQFVKSVSPINYVTNQSPPVFIIHGNADPIVPYQQSVLLYNKLISAGVKTEFITVEGGLHGKFTAEQKSIESKAMWDFLKSLDL
jgi:acetyl esterase/lipase